MLGLNQIKRVLKHCENADEKFKEMNLTGDEGPVYFDYMKNKGWIHALRLVLEKNTQISNKPLEEEDA